MCSIRSELSRNHPVHMINLMIRAAHGGPRRMAVYGCVHWAPCDDPRSKVRATMRPTVSGCRKAASRRERVTGSQRAVGARSPLRKAEYRRRTTIAEAGISS